MFSRGFCLFLGIFVYPIVLLCAVYTVGGGEAIESMLFWLGFLFVFCSGFMLADFIWSIGSQNDKPVKNQSLTKDIYLK